MRIPDEDGRPGRENVGGLRSERRVPCEKIRYRDRIAALLAMANAQHRDASHRPKAEQRAYRCPPPLPRLAPHLARRGPEAEQVEVLVPRSNSRPHTEMRAAESARWRTVRTPCSLCGQTNMDLDAPANTPGIGRTSEP